MKILKVRSVGDYCRHVGAKESHPLVCAIDYGSLADVPHSLNDYGIYGIFFHDEADIELDYGCGKYDYKKGTVICVAPGQLGGKEDNGERVRLTGWALLFHPDLLHGTRLEKEIRTYSFFDYRVNEALHMTEEEQERIVAILRQVKEEIEAPHDEMQDSILVGYLSVLLRYCQRFYHRQFLTRKVENTDILKRFDRLLQEYFDKGLRQSEGLPTVRYFADRLCLSANYFGDLVKKTTGDTAGNRIRSHVVRMAKNHLASGLSISETAYRLGFIYPQHLSRMFKIQTGMTPSGYIRSLRQ